MDAFEPGPWVFPIRQWYPTCVASASPGNLLEMQVLGHRTDLVSQDSGGRIHKLCFHKPWCQCENWLPSWKLITLDSELLEDREGVVPSCMFLVLSRMAEALCAPEHLLNKMNLLLSCWSRSGIDSPSLCVLCFHPPCSHEQENLARVPDAKMFLRDTVKHSYKQEYLSPDFAEPSLSTGFPAVTLRRVSAWAQASAASSSPKPWDLGRMEHFSASLLLK